MRKLIFNLPTPQTDTAQFPLAREQQVVWIKSQKGKYFLGAKARNVFGFRSRIIIQMYGRWVEAREQIKFSSHKCKTA